MSVPFANDRFGACRSKKATAAFSLSATANITAMQFSKMDDFNGALAISVQPR